MSDTFDRYEQATAWFASRLSGVGDKWGAPTPCTEWDVRALVDHVVDETRWLPPLVAGKSLEDAAAELAADPAPEDRAAGWTAALSAARAALGAPGALDGMVELSYGREKASGYCDQMSLDALIHGWDLARGIGADDTMPPALVAWAFDYASPMVDMFRASGVYGSAVEVAEDADLQTRLLALMGRRQ